jgi:hypothetical protein
MSQANDVAKGRHFLYYLARSILRAANCEPRHGICEAERIPIASSAHADSQQRENSETASECRDGFGTIKTKAAWKHSNWGLNYVTFARRPQCRGEGELEWLV